MSRAIVDRRILTKDVVSILMSMNDMYRQISESYLCGRFDLNMNDKKNIVEEGKLGNLAAYFDIDVGECFWHLNAGMRYVFHVELESVGVVPP